MKTGEYLIKCYFQIPAAASKILRNNEWTEEEKRLVEKTKDKILFLGIKNRKLHNVVFTNDVRKLALATNGLSDYDEKVRKLILSVEKISVKESVTSDELVIQAISTIPGPR